MESLQETLQHNYLVIAAMATELYGNDSANSKVKFRDKAKGRHRFTKEEVNTLLQILTKLAKQIESQLKRLDKALQKEKPPQNLFPYFTHPMLHAKHLYTDVGIELDLNYDAVYAKVKGKTNMTTEVLEVLKKTFIEYSNTLQQQVQTIKAEKKNYLFSQGRGITLTNQKKALETKSKKKKTSKKERQPSENE